VPVFPRDAAVNRVIRFHCPDFAVPDVHFKHAVTETVFATGRVPDNFADLLIAF